MNVADAVFHMLESGRVSVMVENWRGKPRHLRVYKDESGYYVRTGKRAVTKRYLTGYKTISNSPFVAIFH